MHTSHTEHSELKADLALNIFHDPSTTPTPLTPLLRIMQGGADPNNPADNDGNPAVNDGGTFTADEGGEAREKHRDVNIRGDGCCANQCVCC